MIQYDKREPALFQLYQALATHKRPMVCTFSCIMLVAIAATILGQRVYTSEAKLFVRLGRESVSLDPTATTGQVVMVSETRENEINSILELLKSREILTSVVAAVGPRVVLGTDSADETTQAAGMFQSFNLFGPFSIDDEAIKHLTNDLKIVAVRKSNVINISYEAKSPELARDVVANLIEQAREAHGRVNRIHGSHEFFASQASQLRDKVARLEVELVELKNASGVSSLGDQRVMKLQQITALEDTLLKTEANLTASNAELRTQQDLLKKIPQTIMTGETTGMPHSAAAAMREQLFALQVREKETASKYSEVHPLTVLIRDQVASLQAVLDREPVAPQVAHGLNTAHQEVSIAQLRGEASAASLQARTATVRGQLSNVRQELTKLNSHEVDMARLTREIEMETANYKKYAENLEQARIDHELEMKNISNLNVLQLPTCSITPTRPRRLLNLTLGLFGALTMSLGVGLFLEQRRSGAVGRLLWPFPQRMAEGAADGIVFGGVDRGLRDRSWDDAPPLAENGFAKTVD
jgi:polysaccharide biosynthesis protein PslE